MSAKFIVTWLRRLGLGFVLLLALLGLGRLGQLLLDSHISGARAPYLQMQAPDAVTLRWQSEAREVGVLRYGRTPERLDQVLREERAGTMHELRPSGLKAATRYWYALGTESEARYGADPEHWFETAPAKGQALPTRFWVLGDPGYPGPAAEAVHAAARQWWDEHPRAGRPGIDLILTTGDNAYRSGSNRQFEAGFFRPLGPQLRHTPVWPVYGNHDERRWAFFELFSFPTQGESGGLASGSERYYSFDYGAVHVLMLDSQSSDLGPDGPMALWLERDLAANRLPWTLALLHHPPYSKGSHNSDRRSDSGGRMVAVREHLLPILERGGVDLLLAGHSHMYERSHLLAGHYGPSAEFEAGMIVDAGEGGDWQRLYRKPCDGAQPARGSLYAVVGSSSKLDNGPLDHPAMAVALREHGSLMIDIEGPRMSLRFINAEGFVSDEAVLDKGPQGVGEKASACPWPLSP